MRTQSSRRQFPNRYAASEATVVMALRADRPASNGQQSITCGGADQAAKTRRKAELSNSGTASAFAVTTVTLNGSAKHFNGAATHHIASRRKHHAFMGNDIFDLSFNFSSSGLWCSDRRCYDGCENLYRSLFGPGGDQHDQRSTNQRLGCRSTSG